MLGFDLGRRLSFICAWAAFTTACLPPDPSPIDGGDAGVDSEARVPCSSDEGPPAPGPCALCAPMVAAGPRECTVVGGRPFDIDTSTDPAHCGACSLACQTCTAGSCGGARRVVLGGTGLDRVRDMGVTSRSVVVVGSFGDDTGESISRVTRADFGVGPVRGIRGEGFVASYADSGALAWAGTIGGPGDDAVHRIAVGPDGTIYVVGTFWDEAHVLGGERLGSRGGREIVVAAISAGGCVRWARSLGSEGNDHAAAIALTPDGGLVIGGTAGGPIEVGGESVEAGPGAAFVISLASDGALRWGRSLGESRGAIDSAIEDLAVDERGAIHAVGVFLGDDGIDDGIPPAEGDHSDAIYLRFTATGGLDGARAFGASTYDTGLTRMLLRPDGTRVLIGWSVTEVTIDDLGEHRGSLVIGLPAVDDGDEASWLDVLPHDRGVRLSATLDDEGTIVLLGTDGYTVYVYRRAIDVSAATTFDLRHAADVRAVTAQGDELVLAGELSGDGFWSRGTCPDGACAAMPQPLAPIDVGAPLCGNGVIDPPFEYCDDGHADGRYGGCLTDCTGPAPTCGDLIVDRAFGEECDTFGSATWCVACRYAPAVCGDGAPARGEVCWNRPIETLALDPAPDAILARADDGGPVFVLATRSPPRLRTVTRRPPALLTVRDETTPAAPVTLVERLSWYASPREWFDILGAGCATCLTNHRLSDWFTADSTFDRAGLTAAVVVDQGWTLAVLAHDGGIEVAPSVATFDHGRGAVRRLTAIVPVVPSGAHRIFALHDEGTVARYDAYTEGLSRTEARWNSDGAPVPSTVVGLGIAGFGEDGAPSLVAITASPARAYRWDADDGTPSEPVEWASLGTIRFAIAANVDSDDLADVVIGTADDRLAVVLGGAPDVVAWERTLPCAPRHASVIDVDGDLVNDVAVASACGLLVIRSTP